MEGNNQKGTYSSFTSELIGSEESHSSSSGIFGSLFSLPSPKVKVLGRESLRTELNRKITNEAWSSKIGTQDYIYKFNGGEIQKSSNNDMSSFYEEQIVQPCSLSSSIYYGGQDIYPLPPNPKNNVGLFSKEKNYEGEDDKEFASRGNWWKGSLYY
ncbi:hypothetical protein Lal_00015835 [Lupinus albus]|uniref:Uncharacterized protein n=1 Tax=Lupinus albus TaxID=3870 RepID=A0A6A4QBZ5_LUPAL|nr:hypothetical protein Lalb_Chr07g0193261 [Lupinus albus]KAF1877173.1 hypothetical protein Lal_00015835 [Lupinus albus]